LRHDGEERMRAIATARRVSLGFTAASALLALVSIQLGRRLGLAEHLPLFNALAATMLGLVAVGLAVGVVALIRARGKSASLWFVSAFAVAVLGTYLLDD
jgi:cytochrome bd-type quinol oxidase subunit 2